MNSLLPPTLAAIELGSAWMLGWLAAAGIPLALHLLHRRRQQEVRWAAMELLLHAIQQNSRTLRIEGWLLLLLRTLALVLFAIALARPLLTGNDAGPSAAAQPPRLWVLVLDTSYSMNYTAGRQSLWQQAQAAALELVSQASSSDAFLLVQLSDPSQPIISQPAFDAQRVSSEIQRLKCSDGGGDLNSCVEVLKQTLEDLDKVVAGGSDIHIVFFSDMGQDTWQPATQAPLNRELQDLSARYHVRIESLAPELPQNLAITALEADASVVIQGRPLRCTATIHNYSSTPANRLPVQFQSDGSTLRTEFIDCPPGQSRSVVVELQPSNQATWSISAMIPDDRLNVDNRRDLVVAVKPQLRVVTIEETSGAARLVNLSLAPNATELKGSASNRGLSVETWSSFDLQSRSLAGVGAVVLADFSELNTNTLAKLKNYVENGGSLLLLAGPRVQPAAWNQAEPSLSQWFGFKMVEPSAAGDWHIDPLGYASPIARPFANYLDAGLLTTPIFRYWKVAIDETQARSLLIDLALDSGDPLLIRRTLGDGSIAAILSAPQTGSNNVDSSANWNAMATWPSFVPIMQRTIETLVGGSESQTNLTVGQPLRGSITSTLPAIELVIDRPDSAQSRMTVPVPTNGNRRPWVYAGTDRAGIYKVFPNEPKLNDSAAGATGPISERKFAVNIMPDQSDMLSVNASSIALGNGPQASTVQPNANHLDNHRPSEWLAHACLWGLLITLVSESLLAWHLGRRLSA